MSDELPIIKQEAPILSNPSDDVPPEKLLELMEIWRGKVESEITDYESARGKVMDIYNRQKKMYDNWLSGPMKKMKKYDKIISARKKVLIDVKKEIEKLKSPLLFDNVE